MLFLHYCTGKMDSNPYRLSTPQRGMSFNTSEAFEWEVWEWRRMMMMEKKKKETMTLGFIWRHFLFYNKEAKAAPWTVNHVHKVPKEKKKRGTHTCATHRGESDKLNERSGKQDKQEREGMEVLVAVGIQSTVFTVREWLTEQGVCFCASQSALSSSAQCSTGTLHSWDSCLSLRFSLCGRLFFSPLSTCLAVISSPHLSSLLLFHLFHPDLNIVLPDPLLLPLPLSFSLPLSFYCLVSLFFTLSLSLPARRENSINGWATVTAHATGCRQHLLLHHLPLWLSLPARGKTQRRERRAQEWSRAGEDLLRNRSEEEREKSDINRETGVRHLPSLKT